MVWLRISYQSSHSSTFYRLPLTAYDDGKANLGALSSSSSSDSSVVPPTRTALARPFIANEDDCLEPRNLWAEARIFSTPSVVCNPPSISSLRSASSIRILRRRFAIRQRHVEMHSWNSSRAPPANRSMLGFNHDELSMMTTPTASPLMSLNEETSLPGMLSRVPGYCSSTTSCSSPDSMALSSASCVETLSRKRAGSVLKASSAVSMNLWSISTTEYRSVHDVYSTSCTAPSLTTMNGVFRMPDRSPVTTPSCRLLASAPSQIFTSVVVMES
mmetsp:Transcript_12264/g.35583  ORF Transcript_12264/g.35583 Transcript_12264/m.35583 type:complete len:273 (-) Transcript_12264:947-1765(-)